ncbi:hypothetical protein [Kribbella sp. HUAS MG21]|uniref:Uncharacterized protein n=1 Tax=Kribbella sp. HUAS MG21 TaxID=3160966 RepID=A0AAU7TQ21_9ACTN
MRKLLLPALTAVTLVGSLILPGSATQPPSGPSTQPATGVSVAPGTITARRVPSPVLGEDIAYNVYLPGG